MNSFDFSELVKLYGSPVSTSSNGQCFVFKKSIFDVQNEHPSMFKKDIVKQSCKLNVIVMSVFGMVFIK